MEVQQKQEIQQAAQQQQKLRANYVPEIEPQWADLLRTLHSRGFADPVKTEQTKHGEFQIEFHAANRGFLNVDAFTLIPAHKPGDPEVKVCMYSLPPGEFEPGWYLIHSGALADVPNVLRKFLSIQPIEPPPSRGADMPVPIPRGNIETVLA